MDSFLPGERFTPPLLSKLAPPRLKRSILRRERLVAPLIENTDKKLILLSAPAGYGKTTLLTDYVSRAHRPSCWLTFDQSDRDPVVFIENVVTAINRSYTQFFADGTERTALINALLDPERGVDVCVRLLANGMYRTIYEDFDLILNDFHLVEDVPALNNLLSVLLAYLPANCRILLTCRTIAALDLTALILSSDVYGMGTDDLRMTVDEVYELLVNHYQLSVSLPEAKSLTDRTEGWVAGIILGSNRVMRQSTTPRGFSNQEQVLTYLATEILQRLPERTLQFLLDTSVLESLDATSCDYVRGTTDSSELLALCERQRLFLTAFAPVDSSERTYQYHALFREFLHETLHKTQPEHWEMLHHRAATLFQERDQPGLMLIHLAAIADHAAIRASLMQSGQRELRAGHGQTVLDWLGLMPETIGENDPDLMLLKAQALGLCHNFIDAYTALDKAAALLQQQRPDDTINLAHVFALRGTLLDRELKRDTAIAAMIQARDLLDRTDESLAPTVVPLRAEVLLDLGVCLGKNGQYAAALEAFLGATPVLLQLGQSLAIARVYHYLSLTSECLGQYTESRQYLETSLFHWQKVGPTPGWVLALVNLASFQLYEGDYTQAEGTLARALEYADAIEFHYGRAHILGYKGDLGCYRGQYAEALALYEHAMQAAERAHETELEIISLRRQVSALRALHRYDEAESHLVQAQQMLPLHKEVGLLAAVIQLHQAALAIDRGANDRARFLLESSEIYFAQQPVKRQYSLKRLLDARLLFAQGRQKSAMTAITDVLTASHNLGDVLILRMEALQAQPLLQFAQAHLGRQSDIQEALEHLTRGLPLSAADEAPSPNPSEISELRLLSVAPVGPSGNPPAIVGSHAITQPIVIHGFGNAEVLVHGTPVREWRTTKTCEMLMFLADRAKPLSKETIIEALWPDSGFNQADNVFKTTVHRLRAALVHDWITRTGSLYTLAVPYWYDVQQFERLVHEGNVFAARPETAQAALACYRAAGPLYKGDYLENMYSEWCIERQQGLATVHLDMLLKQAQVESDLGQIENALATIETCLQVDICNETAHFLRLKLYAHQGNHTLCSQSYQQYTKIMHDEMHLAPAAEITSFYRSTLQK